MCLTALALFFLLLFRSPLALRFFAPSDRAVSDCTELPASKPACFVSVPSPPITCIKSAPHSAEPPPRCYMTFLIQSSTRNKALTRTWEILVILFSQDSGRQSQFTEFLLQWSPPPMAQQQHSFKLPWKAKDLQGIRAAQLPQKQFLAKLMAPPEVHWYYLHWCSVLPINICWHKAILKDQHKWSCPRKKKLSKKKKKVVQEKTLCFLVRNPGNKDASN